MPASSAAGYKNILSTHLLTTLLGADPLCVVMPKGLQYDLRRQLIAAIARYSARLAPATAAY